MVCLGGGMVMPVKIFMIRATHLLIHLHPLNIYSTTLAENVSYFPQVSYTISNIKYVPDDFVS